MVLAQHERGMTMNMSDKIEGVTLTKVCSISPSQGSDEHKKINIRIKFDGAQLGDVFAKAVSSTVISWQNGAGRKAFDTLKDNATVDVQFSAPASRPQIDPESAMVLKLQAMTTAERTAYLNELVAKASKK